MAKKQKKAEFDAMVSQMAVELQKTLSEELRGEHWTSAAVDVRGSAKGGGGRVDKLRISMTDGSVKKSIPVSMEITLLYIDAWKLMPDVFKRVWYGFRLTVFPNGKSDIVYNYDPNCSEDSEFYDW